MNDQTYAVTGTPQDEATHFLHRTDCQVLPQHLELVDLGTFEACGEAMARARERFSPVNGCALCCPECRE